MTRKLFPPVLALLLCLLALVGVVRAQQGGLDPAFQALSAGNVYVDPAINGVDVQILEQASMQAQGNPHTRIKIALLAALPPGQSSRSDYAHQLHQSLGLDKDGLVVVALRGRGAGVSVVSTGLDEQESTCLAKQYASAIVSNPTDSTAALAQAVAADINGKEYRSSAGLWVVFLVVVLVIGGLLVAASRRKKQTLTAARGPIQALRDHVLSGIEYLDGYMDVLPKNNPDSDQARTFRQSASARYEQAVKTMDRATELTDLNRAQAIFAQAQADVDQARRYQDRATGGTGNIPGDDAVRPQPLPDSQPEVAAIPQNQRGVSFFSGRPAPMGSLVPVTLTLEGQSRQVLVTPDEANELRQGRMPQVLAFQQGGQYVPWYSYNGYDPYNDYWRYQNAGWGGFGGGIVAGFVGAELLGGLLMPAYGMGMGYAPYAYATDMPMYQGYAAPMQDGGYQDNGFQGGGYSDTGGSDFMTNGTGGDNSGGYSDTGGSDFMTSGNDAGGGFDGGGFDSGGADFGGGGDFEGGGDFGGGGDSG